jgi:hypothetical protein
MSRSTIGLKESDTARTPDQIGNPLLKPAQVKENGRVLDPLAAEEQELQPIKQAQRAADLARPQRSRRQIEQVQVLRCIGPERHL